MNFRERANPSPVPSARFSAAPHLPKLLEHGLLIGRRGLLEHRARMRSAITWAATTASEVVDMAYHAGAGARSTPPTRSGAASATSTRMRSISWSSSTRSPPAGAVLAGAEFDLTVF